MTLTRRLALAGLAVIGSPAYALADVQDAPRRRRAATAAQTAPAQTMAVGESPLQAYDLYAEPQHGPLLMFVHGGGWSRGDRRMVSALPDYAHRHGFTLASADYRLAPAVTAREAAMDVAAAAADLMRRLPGRPLFLLGHSAGAHLSALVGVDPAYLGVHGAAPEDLGGVILLDGAGYDATASRGDGPIGRWLGRTYDQAFGDQAAELSPLLRIRPGRRYPPFLIFHVARRRDSTEQSRALAEALVRAGGRADVVAAPGDSHMTINRDFGLAGDAEGEHAARFIRG